MTRTPGREKAETLGLLEKLGPKASAENRQWDKAGPSSPAPTPGGETPGHADGIPRSQRRQEEKDGQQGPRRHSGPIPTQGPGKRSPSRAAEEMQTPGQSRPCSETALQGPHHPAGKH
eukprot:g27958.t1